MINNDNWLIYFIGRYWPEILKFILVGLVLTFYAVGVYNHVLKPN